ncbi:hypothetical protein [Micromonospora inyonensis]|uniref:hypothetical protein n=1 Tax=Micromonospora inyonensis TaxID=47866 RepID=UPI00159F2128|nr:hypothetical protein [Micromonospora inyonensis]
MGIGQGLVGVVSVSALSEISAKSACADPKMDGEWAGGSVPAEPGRVPDLGRMLLWMSSCEFKIV